MLLFGTAWYLLSGFHVYSSYVLLRIPSWVRFLIAFPSPFPLTHCSLVLLFYTPWKQKTFRFSDVYRGYRKATHSSDPPLPGWWGTWRGGWAIFQNVYIGGTYVKLWFWVSFGTLGGVIFFRQDLKTLCTENSEYESQTKK